MRAIKDVEQLIARCSIEPCDEVKENTKKIEDLYAEWNHYDILPDVIGYLRVRSDLVAKQFMIRESVAALSKAMIHDPFSGVNFSMRGRRYINLGEFELAAADFTVAAKLLPENWYVWYHLGLCNLLIGELDRAEQAYRMCALIPTTKSLEVALRNWRWITYMRMGQPNEAAKMLEGLDSSWKMDGTDNYMRLLRLYKHEITPAEALKIPEEDDMPALSAATQGFGVACYYLAMGDQENYIKTLKETIAVGHDEAWTCFGYAAAEYELNKLS